MIRLTCLHEVKDFKDEVQLNLMEYTRHGERAVSTVVYCKKCAQDAERLGFVLHNKQEEYNWMHKGIKPFYISASKIVLTIITSILALAVILFPPWGK